MVDVGKFYTFIRIYTLKRTYFISVTTYKHKVYLLSEQYIIQLVYTA